VSGEEAGPVSVAGAAGEPGAAIPITSVPNLRDLGGWPARDGGTVRYGQVYRSTALDRLEAADRAAFSALGVRTVYDLRTKSEATAQPDRLPPGTEYVALDVLADWTDSAPALLQQVETDPAAAEVMLGGGRAKALFERAYRAVVSLPSARAAYRRLFRDLLEHERRPVLFHCETGKDRTGWAAAALLLLLGVSDELVMREYLLTNEELLPAEKPLLDRFRAAGVGPDVILPLVAVEPDYLAAALDEMRKDFGAIEGYFATALGIDEAGQAALRSALVEPA
jgi:protein-tyrosine phosphatase